MSLIGSIFTAVTGIPCASDRALLDALCLACLADGASTELEEGYALGIALELAGFARTSREELVRDIAESHTAIRADADRRTTMQRIANALGTDELREQAFALAAVIIAVDMDTRPVEQGFLDTFCSTLGVSPTRTQAILGEITRELDEVRRGAAPRPGT